MTPIAVIGGAGFIGLHVCRELRARGAIPWVFDDFRHGPMSEAAAREVAGDVVLLDARLPFAEVLAPQGFATVINLATVSIRACLRDPNTGMRDLAAIGVAVPLACARAGVRRYVYVSSSEVYGEATCGPLRETDCPRPAGVYGAGKLLGEHAADAARIAGQVPEVVIVRPFNAYGPGCHVVGEDAVEAIPRWIMQAARGEKLTIHGDGQQTRDYTYIEDLARGVVDAALSEAAANTGPINLCGGIERSVAAIAREVVGVVGGAATRFEREYGPDRPGQLRRQVGSAARAATLLGWSPRVPWSEGLRRTRENVLARIAPEASR